jgi:hypothetical protein
MVVTEKHRYTPGLLVKEHTVNAYNASRHRAPLGSPVFDQRCDRVQTSRGCELDQKAQAFLPFTLQL